MRQSASMKINNCFTVWKGLTHTSNGDHLLKICTSRSIYSLLRASVLTLRHWTRSSYLNQCWRMDMGCKGPMTREGTCQSLQSSDFTFYFIVISTIWNKPGWDLNWNTLIFIHQKTFEIFGKRQTFFSGIYVQTKLHASFSGALLTHLPLVPHTLQWRHNGRDSASNHQLTIVYSTVYSGAYQRKHQSSASLAFVRGIHRWPVNYPHKGPVTRKLFPFDDVIMACVAELGHHWFR